MSFLWCSYDTQPLSGALEGLCSVIVLFSGYSVIYFYFLFAHQTPSALRKHAYLNTLIILQPKKGKFPDNKSIFFIYLLKT